MNRLTEQDGDKWSFIACRDCTKPHCTECSEFRKQAERLARYENAEGLIGTEIFYITNSPRVSANNKNRLVRVIKSRKVNGITIGKDGYISMKYGTTLSSPINELGKTVFFSINEAEAALKND